MSEIGERLRALRKLNNESQQELSNKTGVHRSYIADVEAGRREPSYGFIQKLIDAIRVSPTWLMTGEGPMFLAPADRVASESPEDEESSLAVNALREDILAQKIVLMLQGVDEEGRREILANAEKIKQAAEERARLVELEAQVEVLKGLVGKRAG